MDFIERIFGFDPDNSSGWFEMLLFLIPLVLFSIKLMLTRSTNQRRKNGRN